LRAPAIDHAEFRVFDGVGHGAPDVEAGEEYWEPCLRFLRQAAAARSAPRSRN